MSNHPVNLKVVRDTAVFWSEYRKDDPVLTRDVVVPHWQNGPGPASLQGSGAPPAAWQAPVAGHFDARRPDPVAAFSQRFLTEAKPDLGRDPALWSGTKILGRSGAGIVGLWNYTGPDEEYDPIQFPRQIVVKETVFSTTGLNDPMGHENKLSAYLSQASGNHIVKLIHGSTPIAADDSIALRRDVLSGMICRLYFEYCPLGDLKDLIAFRESKGTPFLETTLWMMFKCLIEGCMALETGIDRPAARPDPNTGQYLPDWRQVNTVVPPEELRLRAAEAVRIRADEEAARREAAGEEVLANPQQPEEPAEPDEPVFEYHDWDPVIHFDMKPRNIFLSRDMEHNSVPICKIGDFGLSENQSFLEIPTDRHKVAINNVMQFPYSKEAEMRLWGTENFYPPEQFTKRWDYNDWRTSHVAGNYTPAMNIWGIGNIMYSLITIQETYVDISKPFKPSWEIQGVASKGITYGKYLENSPYSKTLKDAVWACLYEKPENRPTSFELLALVEKAYPVVRDAAEAADEDTNESWNLFVTPWDPVAFQQVQPQPQPPVPAPAQPQAQLPVPVPVPIPVPVLVPALAPAPARRGPGRPRKNPLQGLIPAAVAAPAGARGRGGKKRRPVGRPRKVPEPPSGDSYSP